MNWNTSNRSKRLPSNWKSIRNRVRQRALASSPLGVAQCEAVDAGQRCTLTGTECDHLEPMTDDHRLAALQWRCKGHHRLKTVAEAQAAKAAIRARRYRDPEPHPGFKKKHPSPGS